MTALFQFHADTANDHVPGARSAVEWATPANIFDPLNAEFGFTLDVCASAGNAKCARYFTRSDDGLAQSWGGGQVCWMNPPYARKEIDRWMRRAFMASCEEGATVVCLVPSSTSTAWWHDYAMRGEVRFVRGRIRFGGAKHTATFPNAIVIFRPAAGCP